MMRIPLLLDIQPGDEVIVPDFAFVSTINAYVLRGTRPVFSDIRPDTLNLDESQLAALITPRIRALVAMRYGGVACEMNAILSTAERYGGRPDQCPVTENVADRLLCLPFYNSLTTEDLAEVVDAVTRFEV